MTYDLLITYYIYLMYAQSLIEVGKLIYLVGSYEETATLKKILQSNDGKSRIFYKCVEDVPATTFKKIKYPNARSGILRSDWLSKVLDRYPQMVVFLFRLGDDTMEMDRLQAQLRQILKKLNLFSIDVLKQNGKEDIVFKVIVTITKQQSNNAVLMQKINYYLKTYEKDIFIVQNDSFIKDVAKYRATWLGLLQKNYDRKLRKLQQKADQSISIDKKITYHFKTAIYCEILSKGQKKAYQYLYNQIKQKFTDYVKKQFTFFKYLEIRQLRIIADTTLLRQIKYKIQTNIKFLPQLILNHINFFKMRSMQANSCHFFFYFQQLLWRSNFLQNLLQVLYSTDIMQLIPNVTIAQYVNGLLSYLHRMATITPDLLKDLSGNYIQLQQEIYLGKYPFGDITELDMIVTGMTNLIKHRKDYISKGIQLITRYKSSGLFRANQINFLNIYLIRFYLADGKFASIISIYNEILKIEINRCNYFLINELFNQIKQEMDMIDSKSKILLYGVASLICDFFQNKNQLKIYLKEFLTMLSIQDDSQKRQPSPVRDTSLFANQLAPEAHIFKLKKSSSIFAAKVLINDQIILSESQYHIKISFTIDQLLRQRLKIGKNRLQLHFNQPNMICQIIVNISEEDGQLVQRQIIIEPLTFIRRDSVLKIQEMHLIMENKNLVWLLERKQIIFERYDSSLFFCKMEEPQIIIESIKKLYYINETAYFFIVIKGIQGCKVTSKFQIEEKQGKTQFFMKLNEKKDLTNSKVSQQLKISDKSNDQKNICWIKVNQLGAKTLKLNFVNLVQKTVHVKWREKPLNLKTNYTTTKQINFSVANLFTIQKIFREAITGNLYDNNIPINKKTLLCFYVKAAQEIMIKELGHHNNPRKIKYLKNIRMNNTRLAPSQKLKVNLLFQIGDDCQNQFQLFLTTLFIKWSRVDNHIPVDNIYLDEETKINSTAHKALISFQQKNDIVKRKKSSLYVKVQNLCGKPISVYAKMQSTQYLLRIGQNAKGQILSPFQKCQINFEVLSIHSGIYDFPPVKVYIDDTESNISTNNLLVYCS